MAISRREGFGDRDVKEAFRIFDTDGSGFLEREEFYKVMTLLGEKMDEEEFKVIMEHADTDGDGRINYLGD